MEGASQERGQVRGVRREAADTPDCIGLGFRRRLRLQPSCSLPLCGGEWEARAWAWAWKWVHGDADRIYSAVPLLLDGFPGYLMRWKTENVESRSGLRLGCR